MVNDLINEIKKREPYDRVKFYDEEIKPKIISEPMAVDRNAALNDSYKQAAILFNCSKKDIEECHSENGYFMPKNVFDTYFSSQTDLEFNRYISEKSAALLFESEKQFIEKTLNNYQRLGYPITECHKEFDKRYSSWKERPDSLINNFQYFCYHNYLKQYLEKLQDQIKRNNSPDNEEPQTLKDLFEEPKDYEPAIKILRNLKPRVISAANKYIGKEKGALVLWIKELEEKNVIKNYPPNVYAKLLKIAFDLQTFDQSNFYKDHIRAEKKHLTELQGKIHILSEQTK
jgi:hypothetical protein